MTGAEYLTMRESCRGLARQLRKDLQENAARGFDWEVDIMASAIEKGYEAGRDSIITWAADEIMKRQLSRAKQEV